MADDQSQLQRFSYTQNDLVQQFSIRNAVGMRGSNVVNAVADVSREEKNREATQWRPEFDDAKLNSKIELRDLEIEQDKLSLAIRQFQKSDSTFDWSHDGVTAAVNDAKRNWENKKRWWSGTPQNYFHEMMGKFDAHSNLFKFFPSENNYGAVVAGATKTLVKASVNHKETVEVLSKALKEINDEADSCAVQIKLIRSERVKKALARFYSLVFLFYSDCIEWYKATSARKIRHSLNEKFTERFTEPLLQIRRRAAQVREAAAFGSDAEQRVMRLQQENANDDMRLGFVGVARMLQEHEHSMQQIQEEQKKTIAAVEKLHDPAYVASLQAQQWKSIGVSGSTQLLENARSIMAEQANIQETRSIEEVEDVSEAQEKELPIESRMSMKAEERTEIDLPKKSDIQLRSAQLLDYVQRGAAIINVDPALPLYLDVSMAVALEQWTLAQKSSLLYLEEQCTPQGTTAPSLAAVRIVWSSINLKIPVISFFCEADPDPDEYSYNPSKNSEADPLLGLGYSLIHQLIGLLPPLLDRETLLTPERLDSLDGSPKSWNAALSLLNDLLSLSPPLLSLIIDGLHAFRESSPGQIHQLMEVFRGAMKKEGKILKILFTTYRRATKLLPELRGNEMVILEGPMTGLPGAAMPGTRVVSGRR